MSEAAAAVSAFSDFGRVAHLSFHSRSDLDALVCLELRGYVLQRRLPQLLLAADKRLGFGRGGRMHVGAARRKLVLEAKVVPVELGICRQTSAFRHGSYSPVVSRQRGRLCKARAAAMRPHRQGGLSGVGSRLAAAGRHCRRVGEATSFVGVNPCASFSDVECGRNFNTKRFSSNRVGRSIGRSAGLAPLWMRSI
jgi:hypothetical protein